MGEPGIKRNLFAQANACAAVTLREAMARARWIALDLDTTRFAVLAANSSVGRGKLSLCFDSDYPQISAASRALLGPKARALLEHSVESTKPCIWSFDDSASGVLSCVTHIESPTLGAGGIAFPVVTSSSQSGIVVFFGQFVGLDDRRMMDIHARCFQLFESAASLAETVPTSVAVASRERDCLDLSSHGLTSDEIATELSLSPHTVNQYLTNTSRKLGAVNRVHVVAKAIRLGLIA